MVEKNADCLMCEVQNDATLGSRKSVNVPGEHIDLPALTEKDRKNILLAIEEDIDLAITIYMPLSGLSAIISSPSTCSTSSRNTSLKRLWGT